MRLIRAMAAVAVATLASMASAAVDAPITLRETAGVARQAEPVSVGVPIPRGLLADVSKLCVVDSNGKKTPAQFEVLMQWHATPRHPDGDKTVRWVLVDFQADVPANGQAVYRLTDAGGNPAPAAPVTVGAGGGKLTVRTGNFAFAVSDSSFKLFESVTLDGQPIVQAGPADGVCVEGMDGRRYTSSKDLVDPPARDSIQYNSLDSYLRQINHNPDGKLKAFVEKPGPMRTVVTVEGLVRSLSKNGGDYEFQLYDSAGNKADPVKLPCRDESLGFRARIHAYAGKPFVRVFFTFINPKGISHTATDMNRYRSAPYIADACQTPGNYLLESLELGATLKADRPLRYRFGGDEVHAGQLAGEQSATLYQDSSAGWIWQVGENKIYDPVLKKNMEVLGIKPGGEQPAFLEYSPIHYKILTGQDGCTFMGYRVLDGAGKATAAGNRSAGWVDLADGKVGVTVAVRKFWEMFPKSIQVGGDGRVVLGILPKQWGRGHFMDGKIRRTHELMYRFHGAEDDSAAAAVATAFNTPLAAHCGADWYLASGACWLFAKPDTKNWPNYEAQQMTAVHVGVNPKINPSYDSSYAVEREKDDAFGWQHFGDTSKRGFRGHSQFEEFDSSRCLMMHYWRTGDPKFFEEAENLARFLGNIPCFGGGYGHQHPESSHNWIQGLIDYWCMTGNLEARDGVAAMEGFYRNCQNEGVQNWHFNGRNAAYALNGLRQFFELTGDPVWTKSANTCIRSVKRRTRPVSGFYGGNPGDFMQHVLGHSLGRFALETGDEDAIDLLLGLSGFFKPFSGQGNGGDTGDLYALSTLLTGEPTYLDVAKKLNKDSDCVDKDGPHYRTGTASSKTWSGGVGGYYQLFFYAARQWQPADTVAPAAVKDLAAAPGARPGEVVLTWTSTGDDGDKGAAKVAQIKCAPGEIVELIPWGRNKVDAVVEGPWKDKVNFWYADNLTGEPAPAAAGQKQTFTAAGLPSGKTLYFVIKLADEAGNRGPISNCVSATVP